jgi:hypothetical protein
MSEETPLITEEESIQLALDAQAAEQSVGDVDSGVPVEEKLTDRCHQHHD